MQDEDFGKELIESFETLFDMRDRMRNAAVLPWDKYLEQVNKTLDSFFDTCAISYHKLQNNLFLKDVNGVLEYVVNNCQDYHDDLNKLITDESKNLNVVWRNYFFAFRHNLSDVEGDVKTCLKSKDVSTEQKQKLSQNFNECVDLYNEICKVYNFVVKNFDDTQMKVYGMKKYEHHNLNLFDKSKNDKEK